MFMNVEVDKEILDFEQRISDLPLVGVHCYSCDWVYGITNWCCLYVHNQIQLKSEVGLDLSTSYYISKIVVHLIHVSYGNNGIEVGAIG